MVFVLVFHGFPTSLNASFSFLEDTLRVILSTGCLSVCQIFLLCVLLLEH